MKIRIKGNSLRYRLSKKDVALLSADGYIEESVDFGNKTLIYAIQQNQLNNLSVVFEDNKITLFISGPMIEEWISTERVGFESQDNGVFLLAEKDFKCLDNVAEDQSDNYPNPLAFSLT